MLQLLLDALAKYITANPDQIGKLIALLVDRLITTLAQQQAAAAAQKSAGQP